MNLTPVLSFCLRLAFLFPITAIAVTIDTLLFYYTRFEGLWECHLFVDVHSFAAVMDRVNALADVFFLQHHFYVNFSCLIFVSKVNSV